MTTSTAMTPEQRKPQKTGGIAPLFRGRALFLLAFALAACAAACGSGSEQLMARAEARWREGNYLEAIQLNRWLYERDPEGSLAPKALLNIGNIHYRNLRRIKDAVVAYRKVAEEFPGFPEELEARLQLAAISENEIVDLTEAVNQYDRILERTDLDDRLEIEFRRANAYFKMEDYSRALRQLRRMEEAGVAGHLADQICLKIGNIYQIQRRYEDAKGYFERVEQSPCPECRHRAITSLAETYESLYDFQKAIETIRKLDRTPENDRRVAEQEKRLLEKERKMSSGNTGAWPARR